MIKGHLVTIRYFDFGNLIVEAAAIMMACLLGCSSAANLPHYWVAVIKFYSNLIVTNFLFPELFHRQALYFTRTLSYKYHYLTFKHSVFVIYLFDSWQIIQIIG